MKIGIVILAAGNSSRFGGNKLLHPIDGEPMYRRIFGELLKVREICSGETETPAALYFPEGSRPSAGALPELALTVVTQYEEIGSFAAAHGVQVLYNPHPEEGISGSLQLGLKANRDADACLFTVADQPWLTCGTVCRLIFLFLSSGKGIACASHGGKLGNPCVFSKKYYEALMELNGDVGGKHVVTANRADTAVLETEDGRELTDIDYPRQRSPE